MESPSLNVGPTRVGPISAPRPVRLRVDRARPGYRFSLGLLGLLALAACVGPRATPRRTTPRGEMTAAEFRELLAKGTIKPVIEMEGEDAFGGITSELADPPEAPLERPPRPTTPKDPVAPVERGQPQPDEPEIVIPENPYLVFGERIKVYPDGTITKPYPMRVGTGEPMAQLIRDYGNFPLWVPVPDGPTVSTPGTVKIEVLPNWDVELYQDLRNPSAKADARPLADWLVITTGQELLHEVEDFINLFAAGVPQIEIEAKIVEITFDDLLDVGVRSPTGVPLFQWPDHTFVKSFDSNTGNQAEGNEGLLTLGGVKDGFAFNAILEAVASYENVSIISRPKIAVREGGHADIANTLKIPFLQPGNVNTNGTYTATVAYQEVGVKLYVVPRVIGTETVALNIDVEASQQSGSETILVSDETQVTVPRLSLRTAHTVVYLQPGQAVILGGLITERNVEQIKKVPLLGDIPVLRNLFRSRFTRKEQTNVLFFIRPRILQGTDLNREF